MTTHLSKKRFFEKVKASQSESPSWLLSDFDEPAWIIHNDDVAATAPDVDPTLRIDFFQALPDTTNLTDRVNNCFLGDLKRCLIFALSPYSPNRLNRFSLLYKLANDLKHLAVFFSYNDIRARDGKLSLSAAEPWAYREFSERAAKGGAFSVRYIDERSRRLLIKLTSGDRKPIADIELKDILQELGLPSNYVPKELAEIIQSFGITVSTTSRRLVYSESNEESYSDHLHVHKRSNSRYNSLIATWQYLYNARRDMERPLLFDPSDARHASPTLLENATAPKRRTQSIPNDVAFPLLNFAAKWCFVYQPHITEYIHRLEDKLDWLRSGRTAKREYYMKKAFELVDQPKIIREIGVGRFTAHKRGTPNEEKFTSLSIEDIRHLSTAAFFILTATLTARRRSELVLLRESDLTHVNGNSELVFLQRKSGVAGPNKQLKRPIPAVLSSALEDYIMMDRAFREKSGRGQESPLFANVYGQRLSTLHNLTVARLQFFFDYLRHLRPDIQRWHLKPHQLRRLFAQLYFWHRPESNLDSLTWFLGHLTTDETLTYLTGRRDQLDFTHDETDFVANALSTSDKAKSPITIDPFLNSFLERNHVEISDYDSVHYHVGKLINQGLVKSRRLRFDGDHGRPLIAIEFKNDG